MKKIFISAVLLLTNATFANQLNNFNEIYDAIVSGKSVHIVINYSLCQSKNFQRPALNNTSRQALGVFTPVVYQITTSNIMTSFTHLTLNSPQVPNKAVYEYVRYNLADNNNLVLSFVPLDAVTYKPVADKIELNCAVNVGAKFFTD